MFGMKVTVVEVDVVEVEVVEGIMVFEEGEVRIEEAVIAEGECIIEEAAILEVEVGTTIVIVMERT